MSGPGPAEVPPTQPTMPRTMSTNADVVAHVRTTIADCYAEATAKKTPPYKFARHLLLVMREEHLFFVARIDGMPDPRPTR